MRFNIHHARFFSLILSPGRHCMHVKCSVMIGLYSCFISYVCFYVLVAVCVHMVKKVKEMHLALGVGGGEVCCSPVPRGYIFLRESLLSSWMDP